MALSAEVLLTELAVSIYIVDPSPWLKKTAFFSLLVEEQPTRTVIQDIKIQMNTLFMRPPLI